MTNLTSKITNAAQPIIQTWRIANTSTVWAHCASVGFFGFLSIFPVMAVFVLIYGLLFSPTQMQEQIALLQAYVPGSVYDVINSRLTELTSNTNSRLTFSLLLSSVLALYAGSKGIKYLILLINLAFHINEERGFIQSTIRSLSLTLAAVMVVIVAISSIALVPLVAAYFPFSQFVETIALWSRWPILAGIIFLSFLTLYRFGPNRDAVALKKLMPGAALATILWIVLSVLFSIYVQNFNNYSAEFGALSAAVVIMLWLYYSAFIVAFGAIYNFESIENSKPVAIHVYQ
ncbi:YihY/virulence factor BrkB family protein [Psychrobacter sp. DM8]|uniref:YihY/virulence factor BrkB family protein n=1 Tax=unclassified Psychrobacter TaxID=196806 RepID=UPI003F50C022